LVIKVAPMYVRAVIINPQDRTKSAEVELLVDTGALYTMVPRRLLDSIGVKALG